MHDMNILPHIDLDRWDRLAHCSILCNSASNW